MSVTETCRWQLQEVRREVELSRKRSIKLKAQVDQLQKKQEGQKWSQHRERVCVCVHHTAGLLYLVLNVHVCHRSQRRFCQFCGC